MLEWLVGDTFKFKEVDYESGMSSLDSRAFYSRSHYEEQPLRLLNVPPLCVINVKYLTITPTIVFMLPL